MYENIWEFFSSEMYFLKTLSRHRVTVQVEKYLFLIQKITTGRDLYFLPERSWGPYQTHRDYYCMFLR